MTVRVARVESPVKSVTVEVGTYELIAAAGTVWSHIELSDGLGARLAFSMEHSEFVAWVDALLQLAAQWREDAS